jgi:hypothetical protein
MIWAIELEVDFQNWRKLTKGFDTPDERLRWIKMCHRLGSHQAVTIVHEQRLKRDLREWRIHSPY